MQKQKILLLLFLFSLPLLVSAEMSSSSYTISSDVIGSFGQASSSASYTLNDTGGEVGTGINSSTNYELNAGFWNTAIGYNIAVSCPNSLVMNEITGTGQSDLSGNDIICNVVTDNPTGYALELSAQTSYMDSGTDTIAAYSPAVADTPETWSIVTTTSEWGAHLGSTSTTVNTTTWGASDTYADGKWLNVPVDGVTFAQRNTPTSLSGDNEVVWFGAEVGQSKLQPSGTYTVDVTVTVVTL